MKMPSYNYDKDTLYSYMIACINLYIIDIGYRIDNETKESRIDNLKKDLSDAKVLKISFLGIGSSTFNEILDVSIKHGYQYFIEDNMKSSLSQYTGPIFHKTFRQVGVCESFGRQKVKYPEFEDIHGIDRSNTKYIEEIILIDTIFDSCAYLSISSSKCFWKIFDNIVESYLNKMVNS